MTEFNIISPEQFKEVSWKNGKGITKELYVKHQTGEDRFLFRISIAGVTEDGQFSDFTGYDRVLIMLEGNGIVLNHSDGSINKLNNNSETALFSGDLQTSAVLTDGSIRDFNVITLRDSCSSKVQINNGENEIEQNFDELFIYNHETDSELLYGNSKIILHKRSLLHLNEIEVRNYKLKLISDNSIVVNIIYK